MAGDGSGRIRIPESKTDQEAEGVVCTWDRLPSKPCWPSAPKRR